MKLRNLILIRRWLLVLAPTSVPTIWFLILFALAATLVKAQPTPLRSASIASNDFERLYRLLANGSDAAGFTNYHSWPNVVSLSNGVVEAIIVSATGRVQQFRFAGDTNGAFWENAGLSGRAASGFYRNFGGDKAWPSPQSDWNWPPPRGFDGSSNAVSFTNGIVTLMGPMDASYGIRVTRSIGLVSNLPVMLIRTAFERIAATARLDKELGVWIDCQAAVTDDSRCYVPVPSSSIFTSGYTTNGSSIYTPSLPAAFTEAHGLISFGRDPHAYHKLGFDGGTLALVGPNLSLRVDASRAAGATYPDGNSSTEVYTGGGQDAYFELEMMGPLTNLPVGSQTEFITVYSLFHRTEKTPDAEAQKVLSWKY